MLARNIIGAARVKHCFVVVWHWEEKCGKKVKVIDRQFSLAGNQEVYKQDTPLTPGTTFGDDRNAFNNPGTGGSTTYPIAPPTGMSGDDFDQAVIQSGHSYRQGPYNAWTGPNSNTATDNIIERAGGTIPNIPGAHAQNYGEQLRGADKPFGWN